MIVEGQRVTFAGITGEWLDSAVEPGAVGRVLALSGSHAHVQWDSGSTDLVDLDDLVSGRHTAGLDPTIAEFDDSLDMPGTPHLAVREIYDDGGEAGLVTSLDQVGRLAVLTEYTDEAISLVASRIRSDPGMSPVLAQLDADEADSLVLRVTHLVLADRVGGDEG